MTSETITKKLQEVEDWLKTAKDQRINTLLRPSVLACDETAMTTKILFQIQDWEKNQRDEVHGGSVAAMFDTAMGMTASAFSETGQLATADLQISYIRAFTGQEYTFDVEIMHPGRNLIRVRAKATDRHTEKLAATATATFAQRRPR